MNDNKVLLLILEELRTTRALQAAQYKTLLNAEYAIDVNSAYPAEMLKARYGPKPEPVTLCEQALYSHAEGHGNMVHRCNRPKNNHQAHTTSMYGTPINWYSA